MSTYPDSAQLAAFRRSIHNRTSNHGLYEPCITDDTYPTVWPGERQHGIGYQTVIGSGSGPVCLDGIWSSDWRRKASAMRSRAYEHGRVVIRGLDGKVHEYLRKGDPMPGPFDQVIGL